ncbi:MAG: hypothetical protein ACT4QF_20845 [Sporichthyaceae bacterium]
MTTGDQFAAPVYSPDGRYLWQHNQWVPVPHAAPPMSGGQPPYGSVAQAQPGWGAAPLQSYVVPITPKSTAVAILLSFLWPGAGHLYVGADYPGGSNNTAIAFMVVSGVCFLLSLTIIGLVVSFPVWLGTAIYTMINSNRCAQAWNLSRGLSANS